jgi:hypothetical protein
VKEGGTKKTVYWVGFEAEGEQAKEKETATA